MGVAGSASLIGREEELDRLRAFVDGAREGTAKLLLEGEAGIGKTTLWRAGVEHARELGLRVLESRPVAPERELSFAALGDLLSGLHDEIGTLPAPQRRALRIALVLEEAEGEPAEQRAVAAAMLGLLRRLTAEEPLLIALDDIQWVDAPSAGALQFAFRRLDKESVRVLATSRLRPDKTTTMGFDNAERIKVGPLPLKALDQLVRTRLGARFLRPRLRQLEEAAGGNPFYALEIAASLLRSGVRVEPGEPLPIPAGLREVVRDRLATLTPSVRDAALATAALAQPTMGAVQRAIGEGLTAVTDAIAAGILDRDGETLRFTHPLLASTLYEDSPLDQRRDLHGRLAGIVGDPEERARHLAEATDGPDEEVASALEAAGASVVARGAPYAGARLAKQAVDLTPPDRQAEGHRRRLAWARYSYEAGDPPHAEKLLEQQLELTQTGPQRAEVEFELGKTRLATRGIPAARADYERALRQLEGTEEVELRTMVLSELAEIDLRDDRMDSDASERAVALAEKLGKPDLLARALGLHGMKLTLLGRAPPDEYWRRALEVEQAAGEMRYGGPSLAYAYAAFIRGDFDTVSKLARPVADSMRRTGDPMLPDVLSRLSELARISGDWAAATRYAEEAHDLVVQTGRESREPLCLLWKARVALPRGDLDLARQYAEDATALLEGLAPSDAERAMIEVIAMGVFGQIAEVSGRHAEAHEWATAVIKIDEQLGRGSQHALAEVLAADIGCLVALGAHEDAARQLERLVELADPLGLPTLAGFVARAQGLVEAAEGDSAAAIRYLERAVECFEGLQAPWPFEHARTLLMLGTVQRRARQKLAARTTLERTLEIFERLGARLWAEKTRAELRHISGRPSRSGALTATEQSVAELVAAGNSNVEVARELFMSPKTVEWNLSKIYKKLHVRSRAELAAKFVKQAASR
jgi:DNA-binding NarL/FixJ family response regulator